MRLGSGVGNFARKIIDAIQHSLLGPLLVQLLWCSWLAWIVFDSLSPYALPHTVALPVLVMIPGGLFLAWLLGALANRRRRPRSAPPLERLQMDPSNGFEAWSELPVGGLRPPGLMRWIVTTLGARPDEGRRWIEFALHTVSVAVCLALILGDPEAWWRVHPALATPSSRLPLGIAFIAILTVLAVRNWASVQRRLLSQR